jgi:hypothetical protein
MARPLALALQTHAAGTLYRFHDFRRAGIERERSGENDAQRFFRPIRQANGVAYAFTVKIDIGASFDADVGVSFSDGHGVFSMKEMRVKENAIQRLPKAGNDAGGYFLRDARFAAMRILSAFSLMKPAASFWS